MRPIKKLLVANRSEIAIRVFRSAHELGIRTVAIYAHEDRFALHRFKADESYLVGRPGEPIRSYLDIEGIVAIDRAIDRLDAVDPDAAHVAILRHFGGLTIPEAARVVGVSRRTADRLWAFARAWLARELDG
jgi:pyruvate carboxylase